MLDAQSIGGGQALSQYVVGNDFDRETESEIDDEDEQAKLILLGNVNPNLHLYRDYLKWFVRNEVTPEEKQASVNEILIDENDHNRVQAGG